MMFDDYDDYVDEDDVDFYDGGSDDEYLMNADGEIIYSGQLRGRDYFDYIIGPIAISREFQELDKSKQETEDSLETQTKSNLADHVSKFFNDSKYSYVTLRVGQHSFHAHKIILCSWSEVFYKMFIDPSWVNNLTESESFKPEVQELVEPDDCASVFDMFLRFMYSEAVDLGNENVYPILTLADKYMVQELRDACEDFLLEKVALVKGEEAKKAYIEAERLGLFRVQEQCIGILEANISYLCESCLQSMPSELLLRLLQSSNLVVEDEYDVFKMGLTWMNVDGEQEERKQLAEEIFSHIRFPHMSCGKLKSVVDTPLPSFLNKELQFKLSQLAAKAFEWRALAAEEAYSFMEEDFIDPRIYHNPGFSLHSSKSFMSQVSPDIFRKLELSADDQDDYYLKKLNIRVANRAEKNVYKYGKINWEVSAYPSKDTTLNVWVINYVVQTGQEIGHPYQVALSTRLTEEEKDDVIPVNTLHHGTVVMKFTLKVPLPALSIHESDKPTKVWTKLTALVLGKSEPLKSSGAVC